MILRLVFSFFAILVSVVGFMVKLPRFFHHWDKELHAGFYFVAFGFFSFIFPRYKWVVAGFLFAFGVFIELAQQYSNHFFRKKIHGNFDPEDIFFNVTGLLAGFLFMIVLNKFRKIF